MPRLLVVGLLLLTGCTTQRAHRHDALHAHPLPAPRTSVLPQVSRTLIRPPVTPSRTSVWDRLADCESGEWDAHGRPIPGTGRWDLNDGNGYQAGLQFVPSTWTAYKDPGMPLHAYDATREQQITVAERVLADQGWQAWPVCSRKLGLR